MAKYDAATEGRSGDAGVLSDKVRWLAPAAAPAECVNEDIPFIVGKSVFASGSLFFEAEFS